MEKKKVKELGLTLEDLIPNLDMGAGKIVVLPDAPETKTKSGIILLNEVDDSIKSISAAGHYGTIVVVPELVDDNDQKYKVGDRVMFTMFNGIMFSKTVTKEEHDFTVRYLVTYPHDIVFRDPDAKPVDISSLFPENLPPIPPRKQSTIIT